MIKKKKKISFSPLAIILGVCLIGYSILLLFPLLWALMTSFKGYDLDYRIDKIGFPDPITWNYTFVFQQFKAPAPAGAQGTIWVGMGEMYFNSILYAFGCAFFNTLVPCITAYLCARFDKKLSKIIYTTNIVTMILPVVGAMPAEIQMAKNFGLYDQLWGLWIMKANFLGMYFLVFHAGFKELSLTYTEAAKIDGANNFFILIKIILPLVKNIFFTVMLVNFISFWNDYQVPLMYMPRYPTIAVGLQQTATSKGNDLARVPMRMTAAMLVFLPILAVFLIFQNRLLGNLTMGGIKG